MNVIFSEDNLFEKAQQAKEETNTQTIKEQLEMQILQARLDNQSEVTSEQLKTIFQQHGTVVYESNGVTVKGVKLANNQEILLSEVAQVKFNEKFAENITLDKMTATINKNSTITLVATILPEDATLKNVTWSSSDETIATVDENGVVTAINNGTATITATTKDGTNLNTTCTVNVGQLLYNAVSINQAVSYKGSTNWRVFFKQNNCVYIIQSGHSANELYYSSSSKLIDSCSTNVPSYVDSTVAVRSWGTPSKSEFDLSQQQSGLTNSSGLYDIDVSYWLRTSYGTDKAWSVSTRSPSGINVTYSSCIYSSDAKYKRTLIQLKSGLLTSGQSNGAWQLIPQE